MTASKHPAKSRVLIVDDHAIVRQGMALLLNQQDDLMCVGEAEDVSQALKAVESLKPDLVLVDLSLQGKDGIELIKDLKLKHPSLPTLAVSMLDEAFYAERVLRAGAKGFVAKKEASERLLCAARQVLKGDIYVSEKAATRLLGKIAASGKEEEVSPVKTLSDRELTIFRLIGQGYSASRIARELHLSVKTVETHRMHIKSKLKLDDAASLLHYAMNWLTLEKEG